MYEQVKEKGWLKITDFDKYDTAHPTFETPWLTMENLCEDPLQSTPKVLPATQLRVQNDTQRRNIRQIRIKNFCSIRTQSNAHKTLLIHLVSHKTNFKTQLERTCVNENCFSQSALSSNLIHLSPAGWRREVRRRWRAPPLETAAPAIIRASSSSLVEPSSLVTEVTCTPAGDLLGHLEMCIPTGGDLGEVCDAQHLRLPSPVPAASSRRRPPRGHRCRRRLRRR